MFKSFTRCLQTFVQLYFSLLPYSLVEFNTCSWLVASLVLPFCLVCPLQPTPSYPSSRASWKVIFYMKSPYPIQLKVISALLKLLCNSLKLLLPPVLLCFLIVYSNFYSCSSLSFLNNKFLADKEFDFYSIFAVLSKLLYMIICAINFQEEVIKTVFSPISGHWIFFFYIS